MTNGKNGFLNLDDAVAYWRVYYRSRLARARVGARFRPSGLDELPGETLGPLGLGHLGDLVEQQLEVCGQPHLAVLALLHHLGEAGAGGLRKLSS